MSYLILLPCMCAVYYQARRHDLNGVYFAAATILMTVILAHAEWLSAGVDTMVATCLTMCAISVAVWYVDKEFSLAIEADLVKFPSEPPKTLFCSKTNHDFAIAAADFGKPLELINVQDWEGLNRYFSQLSAGERQGVYASMNYSRVSSQAATAYINAFPQNVDAHLLYGHLKVCEAKRYGLVPGVMPEADAAEALAVAFKHFRIARRMYPQDAEPLCGLIITKGCVALRSEQIEASLIDLLRIDSSHIHGVMAAARFLIKTPAQADRFLELVRKHADDDLTRALACLVTHIECGRIVKTDAGSAVVTDIYQQLCGYRQHNKSPGLWQQAICDNLFAYAFKHIGDSVEAEQRLSKLKGLESAYPWCRPERAFFRLATVAF